MSAQVDRKVTIVEVSARDGLQADPSDLTTDQKVELILRAARAGVRRIETVSFVNPERVPKMADADAVMAALHADGTMADLGARSIGLVLNRRGLDRAVETGVDEVNSVVVCTDTFAKANQGRDSAGLLAGSAEIVAGARAVGLPVSVTVSAAFGCPYEGEVPTDRLAWVLSEVVASGPDEIALADSIGVATPLDVRERVAIARDAIGDAPIGLRAHFHNTRNTGLANAVAAVEAGIPVLDASLGGVGGCPFAPGATGNIPTEDLIYLLHRMGYETGVDLAALTANVPWVEEALGHAVPGALARAGLFPCVTGLHLALGIGVLFTGALIQSTVGFGAALFSVPLLLLIDPSFVPGPATIAGMVLNVLMTVGHRAHTDRAGLRWIVVGLVPGSLLALVALRLVPNDDLAVLSGAAILVAVAITAVGFVPRKRPATLSAAGVVSGFMGTTAAISGPPLALLYQRDHARTLRGTLPTAFLVSSTLALVMLSLADRLPAEDWLVGLALAPGGLAGFVVGGRWLAGRVDGSRLQVAVLAVSAASAALAMARAIS